MKGFDGVVQDGVVLQDGALEGRVFEDLGPCWVTGEFRFVAERDLKLVRLVCCAVDPVASGYWDKRVSADE